MKNILRNALFWAGLCASSAYAQSSVTLYGLIDTSVRYTTHTNAQGDATLALLGGGMSQSRWGVRGSEDLGQGLKSVFNLESRFSADTGLNIGNFWQQAWVGLQHSDWGQLTFGRQYNLLFDTVNSTYGSYQYSPNIEVFKPEVAMMLGLRASNMAKYTLSRSGFKIGTSYALGETAGQPARNSAYGLSVSYSQGPFAVAGAYHALKDTTSAAKAQAYTLGGVLTLGKAKLNLGWIANHFDQSFLANTNAGTAYGTPSNPSPAASGVKKRTMYFGGVAYDLTPQLNWGIQLYYTDQAGYLAAREGSIYQASSVLDYRLSKRTDAYLEVDYTNYRHGTVPTSTGQRTQLGTMAGIRHRF